MFFKKVLILNPYPQTPFPRKGAECGAAALTPLGVGLRPKPHFQKLYRFFYSLTSINLRPFYFEFGFLPVRNETLLSIDVRTCSISSL